MKASYIIEAARKAGALWAQLSPRDRRKMLSRFAAVLASHQHDLVSAIVSDTDKHPLDALSGDVLVTLEHMSYYRRHAHKILRPRRIPRSWLLFHSTKFTQILEPHGVVLVFGPSNYPLQLALVPAVTALYAGNAVILKISERTPALAATLRDLILEAHLPEYLLQVVSDSPETSAEYIDAHPDFICFTGSSANGALVAESASRHLIPAIYELGGKDAAIVFSDCNLDRTVEGVLYGAFSNSGQVCVGIKRLYIDLRIYDEFIKRLSNRIDQLRIGETATHDVDLTPIHNKKLLSQLSLQIADAIQLGACIVNQTSDLSGATPIMLTNVPNTARLLLEESFGPVICVDSFQHEAEAVEAANNSRFALGASIWTLDHVKATRVAACLSAANIAINDVIRNIANPAASFGGNRTSGYGRYHGEAGLLTFSRTKTVMLNSSRSTKERNWYPFTEKTYKQLRKLISFRHIGMTSLLSCIFLMCILFTDNCNRTYVTSRLVSFSDNSACQPAKAVKQ